jgi:hypothetical protein
MLQDLLGDLADLGRHLQRVEPDSPMVAPHSSSATVRAWA